MELCIKTIPLYRRGFHLSQVSILVLMELCIKTMVHIRKKIYLMLCFNPCFNGTMYKNILTPDFPLTPVTVSILVLMELCIKTLLKP